MIAQLILSLLLFGVVLYAGRESRRSPVISLAALVVAVAALVLVWMPSYAADLARLAGVGRGVDLIIYLWVVISLLVMLNLHIKLRLQLELVTSLARKVAIENVQPAAATTQGTRDAVHARAVD